MHHNYHLKHMQAHLYSQLSMNSQQHYSWLLFLICFQRCQSHLCFRSFISWWVCTNLWILFSSLHFWAMERVWSFLIHMQRKALENPNECSFAYVEKAYICFQLLILWTLNLLMCERLWIKICCIKLNFNYPCLIFCSSLPWIL